MHKVYVTDSNGHPCKNARVRIDWMSGGSSKETTDETGLASFSGNGGTAKNIYVFDKLVRPGPVLANSENPISVPNK